MSYEYDQYLTEHKANVVKGLEWLQENLPNIFDEGIDYDWQIRMSHDYSKIQDGEYEAYDAYFYGGNKSFAVVQAFNKAWLTHIHRNPHHWQYWILINDDPIQGAILVDIPDNYIIEMICDWWAFSWASGNLTEIFDWFEKRREYMKLSSKTRAKIESTLYLMRTKLEEKQ